MDWFGSKVSLGGFPDLAGAVNKLSESVKNIEKNFDSALGFEGKSDSSSNEVTGKMSQVGEASTPAPSDGVDSRMDVMEKAITEISSVFKGYLVQRSKSGNSGPQGSSQLTVDSRGGNEQLTMIKQFQDMKPPSFQGIVDPDVAEAWIKKLEKIFMVLECTDEQKVKLAVFTLEGEADDWWTMVQEGLIKRGEKITWDKFVQAFHQKYFPAAVLERKEWEFANLKQGDMRVDEYQARFNSLVKFVPHVANDEVKKAKRFQKGLKPYIRNEVVPQRLRTYEEVLTTAQIVELDMDEQKMEMQGPRGKGKAKATGNQSFGRESEQRGKRKAPGDDQQSVGNCPRCGRNHGGRECYWQTGACFRCGKMGHRIKDCPLPQKRI